MTMPNNPLHADSHEPFVRALNKHEQNVRAYIRGSGIYRPEDVDEIMQEVALAAWNKFAQLRNVEEFARWACVIARYQILNFRRRHARDRMVLNEKVFDLLLAEALEDTSHQEKRLKCLKSCLEKLPDASRRLVLAVYESGTSIDDLAREMGKKANTLYQKLWRLRRLLEQCVEDAMQSESQTSQSL
jgi:RNA polymerase sigma-70 factor (ECF subfamily)